MFSLVQRPDVITFRKRESCCNIGKTAHPGVLLVLCVVCLRMRRWIRLQKVGRGGRHDVCNDRNVVDGEIGPQSLFSCHGYIPPPAPALTCPFLLSLFPLFPCPRQCS